MVPARDPTALERPVVRARYCQHLVELMTDAGVTETAVLEGTGLLPGALQEADLRISYAQQLRIYENTLRASPEPGLGFRLARRQRMSDHGVFGYAIQSSADLAQALRVTERYAVTTGPLLETELRADGANAVIELREVLPLGPIARMAREEMLGLFVHSLFRLGDPPTKPTRVLVDLPDDGGARYARELGCRVSFGHPRTEVHLRTADLARPLAFSDAETARVCEQRCAELLAQLGPRDDLVDEIRRTLVSEPGRFPDQEEVARALGMSGRTLRRRLRELGSSFREVADEVRRGLAIDYLERANLSVDEIASLLGYTETPNFYRAFKKWTGRAPSRFRPGSD